MDDVGESIRNDLEEEGITCLLQFRDGGKNALIEEFIQDPRSALLGTRSFFEGVDIPNSALKCLVIARLPFPHPDEPLHFSRLRQMANEGIDGFVNLSLPMASLSLRQAVGRLIRTPDDKGSIIFLDNRLITKGYGEALLSGLEMIPSEIGPFDEVVERAASFVGL
jgi:ATP-dependent DNA helicase DinG